MKKILLLMVAIMVIGGMVFAADPAPGKALATGRDAVTEMTTGTKSGGALLTAKLKLDDPASDSIEIGFASAAVNSDTVTAPTAKSEVNLTVQDNNTATNVDATDAVYAYWIIRSDSDLNIKLGLTEGLNGEGGEGTPDVTWSAALSNHVNTGKSGSEVNSIDGGDSAIIASHTNYNTKGSVKLQLTTADLTNITQAEEISGKVTITVEVGA